MVKSCWMLSHPLRMQVGVIITWSRLSPGCTTWGAATSLLIPYVDLEGSGRDITLIYADGSNTEATGSVIAASGSEIRSMTIMSFARPSDPKNYATAVYVPQGETIKMQDVTLKAYNGMISSRGIYVDGAPDGSGGYIPATAHLDNVSIHSEHNMGIVGEEQPEVVGIYNEEGSTVYANDSTITSHSVYDSYGLYALDSSVYLHDTLVETVSDFDKDDNQTCTGIYAKGSLASLTLRDTATLS